jgi:hypothetical protein
MNRIHILFRTVFMLLSVYIAASSQFGFCQASVPASSKVEHVMATALARCYSNLNGVKRITFEPPTNQELADVRALGAEAIAPLARYLDLEPQNGLTQLLAVKFLITIGGPSTLEALKRAFAQDQWEVTRAQALSGIFGISQDEARPYVKASLADKSEVVRKRAQDLWILYRQ